MIGDSDSLEFGERSMNSAEAIGGSFHVKFSFHVVSRAVNSQHKS